VATRAATAAAHPAQATAGSLAGTALLGLPAVTITPADTPPAPTATSSNQHHDAALPPIDDEHADRQTGVTLTDGSWLPPHTAAQVAAMANLFWLRRRQTYHPGHPAAGPPVLPPAASAVTAACPTGTSVRHAAAEAPTSATRLPPGDLTLTGPGALAAARGLLVTALMTNTTIGRPRVHVVIAAPDLDLLLASAGTTLPDVPGLHLTDHPDTLADELIGATPAAGQEGETTPERVLHLTGQRPQRLDHRSPATGALTTLTFGTDAPTGPRVWHVAQDGALTTSTDGGRRLCLLGEQATIDLILLISQAHGLTPAATPSQAAGIAEAGSRDHTIADRAAATVCPPARLRVLGDCRLTVHGQSVPVRRSAAWQILVWLAAHPDGATARQLIETVWPGLPPASITHRLYTTLHDLRTQLTGLLDQPLIVRRGDHYALDPTVVDVDLWQLQTAADTATAATTAPERRHAHQAVLRHYAGDLAAGHPWAWLAAHREAVRNHVLDAYTDLTDQLPAADVLPLLREAITVDPYNEQLHHRTITALADLGNHTAAARLLDTYLERLARAGLHPGSVVTKLWQRVL
jgi:DNA-binding SARP family transcriptional activator